jgi:anti-anti-sigma factor
MLQATVQNFGNARVLCCRGRIVIGEACATLRDTAMTQGNVKLLVLDLAQVDRIDAGGLGILVDVNEWARTHSITFKLMNVMNDVEQILDLTGLNGVFEFCSLRDFLYLLHLAEVMSSLPPEQSNPDHNCEFWTTEQRTMPLSEEEPQQAA